MVSIPGKRRSQTLQAALATFTLLLDSFACGVADLLLPTQPTLQVTAPSPGGACTLITASSMLHVSPVRHCSRLTRSPCAAIVPEGVVDRCTILNLPVATELFIHLGRCQWNSQRSAGGAERAHVDSAATRPNAPAGALVRSVTAWTLRPTPISQLSTYPTTALFSHCQ